MASTKQSSRTSVLKEVVTIGLDLAKTTVHFVGLDVTGQVLRRRQYSKGKLLEVTAKMGPCRIGMEACCGSHHLGRQLLAQGHDVKLMPPKYVKPFVKRDKAKVEKCVQWVEQNILEALRHERFTSLGELNEAIAKLVRVLNAKTLPEASRIAAAAVRGAGPAGAEATAEATV